ncbi:DUF2029 domain-containing protein [Clostridium fermenticellae]|uniref:DUF2029 domain-containing protein n=1 Tax=Clostridium fermenticellae TaxID=2068654 RepID=A0A386H2Q1_9CLOT|nr:glycosyltransferase 87 family protein [Clostridium fermenticellae]AYD39987.1 DUF2029 domain-containing protein [Clostridium fermenticellae]
MILKKNFTKISLFFLACASIILFTFTLFNYKNTNSNYNRIEFNGTPQKSQQNNAKFNKSRNQKPDQNKQNNFNGLSNTPKNNSMVNNKNHQNNFNHQQNNFSKGTSGKYNIMIAVYSIAFIILSILLYYFFKHKNNKIIYPDEKFIIISLLCIGLFLRLFLSIVTKSHNDLNLFGNWANAAANNLFQIYSSSKSVDYPPLYMYILYLIGKITSIPGTSSSFNLLLKLPSVIADIITSIIIYKLCKKYISPKTALLISAFYIFNPAIFIDSAVWGQVDSFFTLLIVLSIFTISEEKLILSSILFSAAILMKPQGIIFLPVLFFELVRRKDIKIFLKAALAAIITAIIIVLPFSITNGFTWIFKLYTNTVGEYPYASVNGFNFFSLIGKNFVKDTNTVFGLSYHIIGLIFIVLTTLFTWYIYIKADDKKIAPAAALLQISGVFTFSTSMHERYLFSAVALCILTYIYIKDKRFLLLSLGFTITVYTNIHYILVYSNISSFNTMLTVISLLNVLLFIYLAKTLLDIAVKKKTYL